MFSFWRTLNTYTSKIYTIYSVILGISFASSTSLMRTKPWLNMRMRCMQWLPSITSTTGNSIPRSLKLHFVPRAKSCSTHNSSMEKRDLLAHRRHLDSKSIRIFQLILLVKPCTLVILIMTLEVCQIRS